VNAVTATPTDAGWRLPSANKIAMFGLIAAESAIFVIFIVAYVFYLGKDTSGPTTSVLAPPVFLSVCLLSSSLTMELALRALGRGRPRRFTLWWLATLVLGTTFLAGTGLEWRHLVADEGLGIGTNLFGTTYYSLVGLHALHVTIGLVLIAAVALFAVIGRIGGRAHDKLELLGMYWHFVDTVWVVVFTLVYLVGR
jgi:cytochrome c oxidase subunit 3/cytochrome o ubiquinol oxidase subunit 3